MRLFSTSHLNWKDNGLCVFGKSKPIVTIEPDEKYPNMWRVRLSDSKLSDMVNLSRARDAARALAVSILNKDVNAARRTGR